jgi:TonB family protein
VNRLAAAVLLLLAAPVATAWTPCEDKGLKAPVPLQRDAPAYPDAVRATGIEGTVELALTVLRDGSVGWVSVVRAEPRGYFEQAATEGVRRWRFAPALQGGEPVECRLRTRVRFTLADTATTIAGAIADDGPQPVYPPTLLRERIEGYAEVEYLLGDDGRPQDARVVTAMPRGEFEQAALAAVREWRGPPSRDAARRETRRFDFRLPDSLLGEVPAMLLASAPFPMAACVGRTTGRVVLEVETLASGQVREARILEASPPGLFDATALAIARGARLTPAYRDAQPIAATALLTLHFDPDRATCPDSLRPDRDQSPVRRPPPRVTRHDGPGIPRAESRAALSPEQVQPLP